MNVAMTTKAEVLQIPSALPNPKSNLEQQGQIWYMQHHTCIDVHPSELMYTQHTHAHPQAH